MTAVNLYGTVGSYFTVGFSGGGFGAPSFPIDLGAYAAPTLVDPHTHPCIIILLGYEIPGTAVGAFTLTYGGVPMTISEAPRLYTPTPYGDARSRFIAVLPFDQTTVFADDHFRFTVAGSPAYVDVIGGAAAVAQHVNPAAMLDQLELVTPATGSAPVTLAFSGITGIAGDMFIGIIGESVGTTANAWSDTGSPTFVLEQWQPGAGLNEVGFYRALTGTETSGANLVSGTDTTAYPGAFSGWYWRLQQDAVIVPNIIGDDPATGNAAIVAAGLVVGVVSTGSGGPPGQIYIQSPVAGTSVLPGSSVDYTWNPATTVPDLYNTSPAAADLLLTSIGLVLNPTFAYQTDAIVIVGNIDAQSIAAGTHVAPGTSISVTLSTGAGGAIVPDIIGLSEAAAIAAILAQGLIVGTIDERPNPVIAAGLVGYQSPEGGDHVAPGSIVSFSLSLGANVEPPYKLVQTDFTWQETVISQYANSATLLQLIANMDAYINPAANMQAFYDFVWNVDTAQGFGLDSWGTIVNVSRLLHIPNSDRVVGFQDGSSSGPGPGWDVEPFGGAPGDPVGGQGIWNQGPGATQTYILPDIAYRRLIFVKALANIVATTVPALNQLLRNLFAGRGNVYVTNGLNMTMVIVFADFDPTPVELAIIEQSGAFPIPPGVSFTITAP